MKRTPKTGYQSKKKLWMSAVHRATGVSAKLT